MQPWQASLIDQVVEGPLALLREKVKGRLASA